MSRTDYWVLTQHTAYVLAGNRQFVGGLEERPVSRARYESLKAKGAAVYDSYGAASDAAHEYMYPAGVQGLTPHADKTGKFLQAKVDGLRVFAPNVPA